MKILCLLAVSLAIPAGSAFAHPREDISRPSQMHNVRQPVRLAQATTDAEPRVRIRGDISGQGLSPKGFSRWLSRHPALVQPQRILASTAATSQVELNRFFLADRDRNGRVSANELADFVMRQPSPRMAVTIRDQPAMAADQSRTNL